VGGDKVTNEHGRSVDIGIPLPDLKPPRIEDGFLKKAGEDVDVFLRRPRVLPLFLSSFASGVLLGANDFANAMGTTVGAGIIPLSLARVLAGSAVWYGGSFGGGETAATVKKGVWDIDRSVLTGDEIQRGLTFSILGATSWLIYATAKGFPVSTSQSAIGGLIGVGSVADALKENSISKLGSGVQFDKLKEVVESWIYAPATAAVLAPILYVALEPIYKRLQFSPAGYTAFKALQVATSTGVAYSIGRNDIANFTGPLAGGIDAMKSEDGSFKKTASVDQFLRMLGGIFVLVGIMNFSSKVVSTIGSTMLELNVAKAVAAEGATSLVVNAFSDMGLPISTSHTIMSAVLGLAIATNIQSIPLGFLGKIVGAWLLSVPVAALVSGGAYAVLASLSSIDRSAPPKPDDGVATSEAVGEGIARLDRVAKDVVEEGRHLKRFSPINGLLYAGRGIPINAVAGAVIADTVLRMAKDGPREAIAEGAKVGVEVIPVVGGIAQAADGIYALSNGASFWTNKEVEERDAWIDVASGVGWTLLDIFGVGILGKIFKGIKKARDVVKVARTVEEAEGAILRLEKTGEASHAAELVVEGSVEGGVGKGGALAKIRGFLQRTFLNGGVREKEEFRLALEGYRESSIATAVSQAMDRIGGGILQRALLKPGVSNAIERASASTLKELGVIHTYAEIRKLFPTQYFGSKQAALEWFSKMLESMEKNMGVAIAKKNPKYLEHAAVEALRESPLPKSVVNGMVKAASKNVPVGVFNLSESYARYIYKSRMLEAVDEVVKMYSHGLQRYGRMVLTAISEPLTLRLTMDAGRKALRPLWIFTREVFRPITKGWIDTINPFRFLKLLRKNSPAL